MNLNINNLHTPQAVPYTTAGNTDCAQQIKPYQTPAGYADHPYIYVFDPTFIPHLALTGASNQFNLSVSLEAYSEFLCRRLTGMETMAQKIQVRDKIQTPWFLNPIAFLYDKAIIPERSYPSAGTISFDLLNIGQRFNSNTEGGLNVPVSQLLFQGIRRYQTSGDPLIHRKSNYEWRAKEYTYVMPVTITQKYWVDPTSATSGVTPPVRFSLEVLNYDFDLYNLSIYRPDNNTWSNGNLKVLLYDGGEYQLSAQPIIDYMYSSDGESVSTNPTRSFTNGAFPCPPVLYRVGSQIQFDVTSLLTNVVGPPPITFMFEFSGIQRLPV